MHTTLLLNLAFLLGAAEPATPAPQPSPEPAVKIAHRVILKDGQELRGRITSETPDTVVLELSSGGQMEMTRASISKIEEHRVTAGNDGQQWWFDDPNRTRYLYAPSAMMLRQGECYFSQKELLFSAFGCGVHPNVSVLFGTAVPAWFLVPASGYGMNAIAAVKVGASVGANLHLAGGFETLILPSSYSTITTGFVFASATAGDSNAHATLSVGKPFYFTGGTSGSLGEAIIVLAADYRLSANTALVSENWLMPYLSRAELVMLNGLALRFLGPHYTVDLGLVRIHNSAVPAPWLDFTYNFG